MLRRQKSGTRKSGRKLEKGDRFITFVDLIVSKSPAA